MTAGGKAATDWKAQLAAKRKARQDKLAEQRPVIMALCVAHRIASVRAEFYGSGDSGSIEDLSITFEDGAPEIDIKTIQTPLFHMRGHFDFDTGQWEKVSTGELMTLDSLITDHIYSLLDETDVDWYNNDGGGGWWELSVGSNEVNFEVFQNEMHQQVQVSHGGAFV